MMFILSSVAVPLLAASERAVSKITPEHTGEFVTIVGGAEWFTPPGAARGPYSFQLRDAQGSTIRVCAWPEIFDKIAQGNMLRTTGTLVRLTAEVAEHNGRLELQIQDWKEVEVRPATTASLQVTQPHVPSHAQSSSPGAAKTSETQRLERKN